MKIVAIANQKGGVGKTTTAVNLGAALAETGNRILLIDLDPQANATSSFGLQAVEHISLYEPLLGEASITEKILPTRARRPVHRARRSRYGRRGGRNRADAKSSHAAGGNAQAVAHGSDIRFCFPGLSPVPWNFDEQCACRRHELLTPIQCEYFALEGLVKIVRLIEQVRDSGANKRLELGGIVMTMFDARTNLSQQVVADVRQHFGERVYETVIPRSVRLSEAPSFGKSILEYASSGPAAQAYRALAREFMQRHGSPATPPALSHTPASENRGT